MEGPLGGVAIPGSAVGEALSGAWIPPGLDRYVHLEAEHPDLVRRRLTVLHARTMQRLESFGSLLAVLEVLQVYPGTQWNDTCVAEMGFLDSSGMPLPRK